MDSFSRIAVVGLGYIGLPTAAVFAENGLQVVGIDVSPLSSKRSTPPGRILANLISTLWSGAWSKAASCAPRW